MEPGKALTSAAEILGARVQVNSPLGRRTTYRVGGPAALGMELSTAEDLALLCDAVSASQIDVLVVGKGSNLLVAESGFMGLAVFVDPAGVWGEIEVLDDEVRAGAAVSLPVLARRTASAGRAGLEWAVGVPGSVGGAVRMNAGGHGSDVAAHLVSAEVVDLSTGARSARSAGDLELGYRHSNLRGPDLVLSARFSVVAGEASASMETIEQIVRWRRDNQPGGQNAGSVFVNPEGDSAGRLVEAAGCKGLRMGSAQVSERHANFIQADQSGSADDVAALIREVQRRVKDHLGVDLAPEVRMVGEFA
ncbi:MAG: UDP-N-acetylmuramate dehydrogenase [Actinobacteria bacterium]|nr:UDP-N-acetylmuramate dehydrogenase [Actinomycetota bacterium]